MRAYLQLLGEFAKKEVRSYNYLFAIELVQTDVRVRILYASPSERELVCKCKFTPCEHTLNCLKSKSSISFPFGAGSRPL